MFVLSSIDGTRDSTVVYITVAAARVFKIGAFDGAPCCRLVPVRAGELRDRLEQFPEIRELLAEEPDCGCSQRKE